MQIWFCLGTAGELIKLYPVLKSAEERGMTWFCLSTGQSAINLKKQWDDFGLPGQKLIILNPTDQDLQSSSQALKWFIRSNLLSKKELLRIITAQTQGIAPSPQDFWLVHGDTLSTLVGTRYGRKLGVPVGHVEAGLRSSQLLEPFPEEITRRIVSRMVRFHFTQDTKAESNLKQAQVRGDIVHTQANTLLDALKRVLTTSSPSDAMKRPYVVANLHRFESLGSPTRWKQMVEILIRTAQMGYPVHFVLHPPTEAKIESEPETKKLLQQAGVILIPRLPFTQFIPLLHHADFVISDGGSNQEECYYLGKPCLILRDSTERVEGLEEGPCVLSRFDKGVIDRFLASPKSYQRTPWNASISPSEMILDHLVRSASQGAVPA